MKAGRFRAGVAGLLLRALVGLGPIAGLTAGAVLSVGLARGVVCCAHLSTTSPGPDASEASATCANLAKLGCAVGADPACAGRLELAVSEHHASADALACARGASSRTALAACGPFFGCAP